MRGGVENTAASGIVGGGEEETEERSRKRERKMDAGVQDAVSRRLKNVCAEAFVEMFRCLGGDVFFLWILWGGRCLCLWWILWVLVWTRGWKGIAWSGRVETD